MSYIDSNLIEGERVVFRTRLHWLVLLLALLLLAVLLALAAWMAAGQGSAAPFFWLPIAAGLVLLLPPLIRRQSSDFAVTNKRVMMKTGVFTTRSIELLLSKVEAIAVDQSLLGRMFGYGDIVITGSGGTHEAFAGIQAPLAFRKAVQAVSDGAPSA